MSNTSHDTGSGSDVHEQTFRDLDILEGTGGRVHLFSHLNGTRTMGPGRALGRRMRRAFADAAALIGAFQIVGW